MNDYDPQPARMSPTAIVGVFAAGLLIVAGVVLLVALIRHREQQPIAKARPPGVEARAGSAPRTEPRAEPAPLPLVSDEDLERAERRVRLILEIVLSGVYLALSILMMAWVAKDCRNRGIDGGAVWVLIVLLLNAVGLAIYMASRPTGSLTQCPHCFNRRLEYAAFCPHCHRATEKA